MIKNYIEKANFEDTGFSYTLSSLKELEKDRLIIRTEYPQIPPKVEYSLSERGKSLMTILDQLCTWGEENKPAKK